MKSDVFRVELDRIKDDNVRYSTETILEDLPDYFYTMPASTSGRFHPSFSLGEGGLVRHVKVAERLLEEVFRNRVFGEFDEHTQDLMRMAIILHDGYKSGLTYSEHTDPRHPLIMSAHLLDNTNRLSISAIDASFVADLIISHMGPWNTDKQGRVIMPVPKTDAQKVIHYCDYFASRNFLNVYFKDNEIADSVDRQAVLGLTQK